ncbi:nucleoside diphosphate kinase regulator [Psychrosphaera sp. F3M07]|uniref:nucleoside diphosphate kinase regulator n=1 Tax=Psychrosphaera sp. F3M07 TaxID=2841560 RepID=UPI001C0968EC|nr:nucleoside diphosphate kinase regulator [Psychrosphaera sp. F3M07]MBU2918085.1 nucleoside diphosphate kinase regulator [Psychrosphaera sp. F3M07]
MEKQPEIIISTVDLEKIEYQLERSQLSEELMNALEEELARASIVAHKEMPVGVVMLESQVTFKVVATDRTFTKTLCLPNDLSKYEDSISIFAPIGSAILGLSAGQKISWQIQGKPQAVEIVEVNNK